MSVQVGGGLLQFTALFIQIFVVDLIYAAPILLTLILSISGIGLVIARIEGWSITDGVYHAFINATTVGYGDFRPTQTASKLLSIAMAVIGLIVTGLIVACAVHAANSAFTQVLPQSISG